MARVMIHRYEMLNPTFMRRLIRTTELVQRLSDPRELYLQEITPDGEMVYIE
jgi:hypothetical protein